MIYVIPIIIIIVLFVVLSNEPKKNKAKLKEIEKSDCKYKDCEIEYRPIAKLYYPKYKGLYIKKWYWGAFDCLEIHHADGFYLQKDAKLIIDEFLEYQGKSPSQSIKLC